MTKDDIQEMAVKVVLPVVLLVAFFVTVGHFKAAAYERVTGKHISAWDALILDVRVISEPIGGDK